MMLHAFPLVAEVGSPSTRHPNDPLFTLACLCLEQAARNEIVSARATLNQLFALRGRFPGYVLMRAVVEGRLPILQKGGLFVLGSLPESLLAECQQALALCACELGLPVPCVIVEAVSSPLNLTVPCFPGLAQMRLVVNGGRGPSREIVVHEFIHAFLNSGLRVLDEGLAYWFAARYAGAALPQSPPSQGSAKFAIPRR